MKYLSFSSEIKIIGVNPYVLLPEEVLRELFMQAKKEKGMIPVKGKINNKEFKQTLVKYAGDWRLYLNTPMRTITNTNVGDTVKIEIVYDSVPRIESMHPEFAKILKKNPQAKTVFEKLSPSRQKEINRYLNNMKTEKSLQRNIDKVIRHLKGDKTVEYFVIMRDIKQKD